jgi:polyhydroxyalkanoate synthase
MGRLVEEYGKVTAAYLKPIERGEAKTGQADEASEMVKTLGRVAERWVSDPSQDHRGAGFDHRRFPQPVERRR